MSHGISPEQRKALLATSTHFACSLQDASAAIAMFVMESLEIAATLRSRRTPADDLCDEVLARAMGRQLPVVTAAVPDRPAHGSLFQPSLQDLQDAEIRIANLSRLSGLTGERLYCERTIALLRRSLECRRRAAQADERFRQLAQAVRARLGT